MVLCVICFIFCGLFFTGCKVTDTERKKIHIVTTCFPAYDFVRTLIADCDDCSVEMLLSPGTESHTYDPSSSDMISLEKASLFIMIGGDADPWAEKLIKSRGNKMPVLQLMDCTSLLEIEGEDEDDPHIWTSPKKASEMVTAIASSLSGLSGMSDHDKASVAASLSSYLTELDTLDAAFRTYFSGLSDDERVIVFGDRYPFRYFTAEYGLTAYAAFPGCSDESEPSAATVANLIDVIKDKNITTVYYVDFSNHRVADAIAEATGTKTAQLFSCHNLSKTDFDAGETYISMMYRNLETMKKAG